MMTFREQLIRNLYFGTLEPYAEIRAFFKLRQQKWSKTWHNHYDGEKLEPSYSFLKSIFTSCSYYEMRAFCWPDVGERKSASFLTHEALGLLDRQTSSQALGSFKMLPPWYIMK